MIDASEVSEGDVFQLVGPAKPLQFHIEFGCLFFLPVLVPQLK